MQVFRGLRQAPGFVAMAVLTLALGIAATTALFSVVNAVLLNPLSIPNAHRIVALNTYWAEKAKTTPGITGGDFTDLRQSASSFDAMATYFGGELGVGLGSVSTRFAETFFVDPNFFRALAITPVLGHLPPSDRFTATAVVTSNFARANFGNIPRALGQTLRVDGKPSEIVAVLDTRLAFPEKAEVWITGPLNPESENRTAFNYRAIARRKEGVSEAQMQTELTALGSRLAALHPDSNRGKSFRAPSLESQVAAPVRTTLLFLFGAAGLLLLIACANVTNLMLARAATRTREMAIRLSLGSSAARIFQLLLAEGAAIGVAAVLLGLGLAYAALHLVYPVLPASIPNAAGVLAPQPSVLLFACAIAILTVTACSLVPALQLRKSDTAELLKQGGGRGSVAGTGRTSNLIMVAQIALCCLLCVCAALLSRTLLALGDAPLGFTPEGVLVVYAHQPAQGLTEHLGAIRTFESVLDKVRRVPGVRSAAAVMGLPTGRYGSNGSYLVEGVHVAPGQDPFKQFGTVRTLPYATFAVASPHYFQTAGIRLVAGRDFNEHDHYDAPFTAVVSEALARQSFGSESPIGRRIYCGLDSPKPMTIVGVVTDIHQDSPASKAEPEIYMPYGQHPFYANELTLTVRTGSNPMQLAPLVRGAVHQAAPFMALRFTTLSEMVEDSIAAPRFRAQLALGFALLAVGLAMAGVYGLMSYFVAERTNEMGVRIALGATPAALMTLVTGRALRLAAAGLAIGLAGSIALSRIAETFLFGVGRLDPFTYAIGAALVLLVVLLAAMLPSWRAARVNPTVVMR